MIHCCTEHVYSVSLQPGAGYLILVQFRVNTCIHVSILSISFSTVRLLRVTICQSSFVRNEFCGEEPWGNEGTEHRGWTKFNYSPSIGNVTPPLSLKHLVPVSMRIHRLRVWEQSCKCRFCTITSEIRSSRKVFFVASPWRSAFLRTIHRNAHL